MRHNMNDIRRSILMLMLMMTSAAVPAQRHHGPGGPPPGRPPMERMEKRHRPEPPRGPHHFENRLTRHDRMMMARAYLRRHKYLSAREYARMTGLKRRIAEAELHSFSCYRSEPIVSVKVGKNLMFTIKF